MSSQVFSQSLPGPVEVDAYIGLRYPHDTLYIRKAQLAPVRERDKLSVPLGEPAYCLLEQDDPSAESSCSREFALVMKLSSGMLTSLLTFFRRR